MVKIPKKCPDFIKILRESSESVVSVPSSVIAELNARYVHWDKLRHLGGTLQGHSPEIVWAALKLARSSGRITLPFDDINGDDFWFNLPSAALGMLHHIDKWLGGSIGGDDVSLTRDQRDRYLINSLMEEAIASSQLEGAATTRKVAKAMLRRDVKPRNTAERMILNNYRTILEIRRHKEKRLTPELINQFHELMTQDTLQDPGDAGRLRQTDDVTVTDRATGQTVHVPTLAKELPDRLEWLCDFANGDDDDESVFIHPVVRAIAVHFWLGYDHPYVDGNGRTARALFYWVMLRNGYWLIEFLPISRIIIQAPAQYARAYLETEHDQGDVTYFLMYNLRAIRRAVDDLREYLSARQQESMLAQRVLSASKLNDRQREALLEFLKNPTAKWRFADYAGRFGVTIETARNDLYQLEAEGFVSKHKQGRAYVFQPTQRVEELGSWT